jgi:hypothetical protein
MRTLRLLSTATAIALLSGGIAFAQDTKKDAAPAPAPAAQQNAPAEKIGPSLKAGKEKAQKENANSDAKAAAGKAEEQHKAAEGANALTPNAAPKASEAATPENRATTGQGAASGAARLSTEQRTQINAAFRAHKVPSIHLNVSVEVGARVPESVHFYPVPEEVIVMYPEWRGYDYIYVGDEIVIVDPRTHEIVAIFEA